MSASTIPRIVATGFVVAAIVAVLIIGGRPSSDEPLPSPQVLHPAPNEPVSYARAAATYALPPAEAKLRELEAMSETFRNTTFLIAIRDAGFVCNELLRVYGALDDAPKWLASCSEMLSYTVSVASDGTLRVEPMMQYFDGPVQRILQNDDLVVPRQELQLPPQPRR